METVQLKGLNYTSDLQDDSSAFSLVLSAVIVSKVGRPDLRDRGGCSLVVRASDFRSPLVKSI